MLAVDLVDQPAGVVEPRVKGKTRSAVIFPNDAVIVGLLGAMMTETNDEWVAGNDEFAIASNGESHPSH